MRSASCTRIVAQSRSLWQVMIPVSGYVWICIVEGVWESGYNGQTVSENGGAPPLDNAICRRCDALCDSADNFCRRCGLSLHDDVQLPSVRERPHLPVVQQLSVPATVVKGAAFVAAGKIAELLVRRLARNTFGRRAREAKLPARRAKGELIPQDEGVLEGAQLVSETFFLRRVRIRR